MIRGDTRFLEEDLTDKFEFLEENDFIFDKKVVTDFGESTKMKAGQIVSLRELREENSILRRNDKKLAEYRDAKPATPRHPRCWVLPRLRWVCKAGSPRLRSRKQPRCFLRQPYKARPMICWA